MMRHSHVFALLVLVFAACKSGPKLPPPDTDTVTVALPGTDTGTKANVLPLDVENYWVYNTTHYFPDGSIEVSDQDTIRVSGVRTFNGKSFSLIKPFFFRNEDHNTIVAYDSITNTEFMLKNNATANNSFVKYVPYTRTPQCKWGIKLYLNKDRYVVKGNDAYKVNYAVSTCEGKQYSNTNLYISEGLGIVKAEEYRFDSTGRKYLQTLQEIDTFKIVR